jgi:hypothetical protein
VRLKNQRGREQKPLYSSHALEKPERTGTIKVCAFENMCIKTKTARFTVTRGFSINRFIYIFSFIFVQ